MAVWQLVQSTQVARKFFKFETVTFLQELAR